MNTTRREPHRSTLHHQSRTFGGRSTMSALTRCLTIAAVGVTTITIAAGPAHGDSNEAPAGNIPAASITAGSNHTCALLDDGSVRCWGDGTFGRLGYGDLNDRGDEPGEMGTNLPPVDLGPGRTATAIAAGGSHTCALLDNATIKCWGDNFNGQLGYGDLNDRGELPGEMGANLPAVDLGPGRTATAIAAGSLHTCALLDNATVKCWGRALNGQLGYGDGSRRGGEPGEMGANLPAIDLGPGRTATAITGGSLHTCALLDNGTVKCWGSGSNGKLGQGDTSDRGDGPGEMGANLPAIDLGPGRTATTIAAGSSHTCAFLDNATIKCWGSGSNGRLGYGDTATRGDGPGETGTNLPAIDLGPGRTATAITTSASHTCALLDNATIKCWGAGSNGRLGHGDTNDRGDGPGEMGANLPAIDLGPGRTATAITTGGSHTCALLDDATMKCWGAGSNGKLGYGDTTDRGDGPGEMGADLPAVDLPRPVGRAGVTLTLTADRTSVIAGATITYTVTVRNTGSIPLTGLTVRAPDTPTCARTTPALPPQTTLTYTCAHTTTATDTPQMSNQVFVRTTQGATLESPRVRTRVDPRTARTDAQIRTGTTTFLGDNTYNTTGTDQTASTTTKKKKAVRYTWRVQNDGNVTDRFVLRGTTGTTKFTITYTQATTNITAAVTAGTFTTANLAPGAASDITVTVTPTKKAKKADTVTTTLTSRSLTSANSTDTVRTTTTRR
jgi:alpha-tubulin suppressor-like RCC1 family protein